MWATLAGCAGWRCTMNRRRLGRRRGLVETHRQALIQAAGCNLGLLLRRLTGVGTPRSLQGRALSALCALIGRLIDRWGRLTRVWGPQWTPAAFVGSIPHRQPT